MTHTPEPWEYYAPIMDDKKGCIIGGNSIKGESIIATIHPPIGENETLEDNARLLLSAPKLLKACKRALDILETPIRIENFYDEEVVRQDLREAIAKAQEA